jgi:histidine ammonia-lyase
MDFLGIAVAELGSISERRIARLVDAHANEGSLPPFLAPSSGLHSGFMLAQYVAAALVSENKVLAHPASVDSIPTSAGMEDHVSMGTIAARKAREILGNVLDVLSIELMAGAQGIDLRLLQTSARPGRGTTLAHREVRQGVPYLEVDTVMYPHLAIVREMVAARQFAGVLRSVGQ